MAYSRKKKAKLNILFSLTSQFVGLLCGFIVPRLLISTFGSEAYGASASITQFLAYISLLEGGVAGVARAALYKPLAENDSEKISLVINEIKRFFRIIAYVYVGYVLILAVSFKQIADVQCFDWITTFILVIVISLSTFAQYFIGISYSVLIQSAQKTYITQIVSIITTVLNTLLIILLVNIGSNIVVVKLVSSLVFVLRPVLMYLYVRKNYSLIKPSYRDSTILNQKWTGLGQHIAFFLHSNTDIAVLTIFANLIYVAIYSVYNMVSAHLQNITTAFAAGMEALFGDMIAKKEYRELQKVFGYYETLISSVTVILFSVAMVLIIPFVTIYTKGIQDANYYQPVFAILLLLASAFYCFRLPYHSATIAAGHFKQTKFAAYGEAIINILLSIILVIKYGLIGVAIGTLVATSFRLVYYVIYLSRHILNRNISLFVRRIIVNILNMVTVYIIGNIVKRIYTIDTFMSLVIAGFIITAISIIVTILFNILFYRQDIKPVLKKLKILR